MRNLKRVLSLALAALMLMGMMVVGAGAASKDFTDASEIKNVEAVDVMVALGILEGGDKGDFQPNSILTREQAAKIICYLLLGPENAEKLVTSGNVFNDVAANRWSAPFIGYCVNLGILAGDGNGHFFPEGKLTGAAFAKMLLVALGYDPAIEKYTGNEWTINVAGDAIEAGIAPKGLVLTDELSRQDAAQMAFQTLTANMVKYANKGTEIINADGSKVVIGATPAEAVQVVSETITNNYDCRVNGAAGVGYQQFCEKYFSDLTKVAGSGDDFGRPADYKWVLDGTTAYNATQQAVATFTADTSAADVAKTLSGYKFVDNTTNTTTYKIENNTKRIATVKVDVSVINTSTGDSQTTRSLSNETTAAEIAGITKNGRLVEIFANDNNEITKIVAVDYKTVEAGKVTTDSKTGDVSYVIDGVIYKDYADKDADDAIVLAGTVAKGDIVTYTKAGGKVYVYPTTTFEGTQTANKVDSDGVKTITVDGNTYTVGAYAKAGTSFANSKEAATYYVDQYGFVVHTDSKAVASTDYAMITDVVVTLDNDFTTKIPTVQVRAVLADGSVAIYEVALTKTDDGKYYITNIGDESNLIYDKTDATDTPAEIEALVKADLGMTTRSAVFGYTVDGSVITLESLTALAGGNTAENTVYTVAVGAAGDYISKSNTSYTVNGDQSVLVNSNTVFVAYNSTKNTATVYTGVSNLPSTVSNTQTGLAVLKTGTTNKVGTASVVFFTITSALAADSTDDLVYVDGSYSTVMVDGKDKYVYTGYKADGTTVELYGATNTQAAGLYIPNKDNEISGSPKTNSDNSLIINSAKLTVEGEMVKSGSNWYYITSDTQIVYVNSDFNEVNDNTGVMVLVKDSSNVDVIYITAD